MSREPWGWETLIVVASEKEARQVFADKLALVRAEFEQVRAGVRNKTVDEIRSDPISQGALELKLGCYRLVSIVVFDALTDEARAGMLGSIYDEDWGVNALSSEEEA